MARRGPKGKSPALKAAGGTDQPCRRRSVMVRPVSGQPRKPDWLTDLAAEIWADKIASYAARGQTVTGCESALAQYCALEAMLISQYEAGQAPPVAQVSCWRVFAGEFFDTPASQVCSPKAANSESRFAANASAPSIHSAGAGNA